MAVAMFAVLFFAFAVLSAGVGIVFGVLGFRRLFDRSSRLFGIYVIGSGVLGAVALVMFGLAMRWNVVGDAIMKCKILGCSAWAAVGFGWSVAAAFIVGSLIRRWFFHDKAA